MSKDCIEDPLIEFVVHVIAHKFYQSSRLNSMSCDAIYLGYKIVKKDHEYDLVELHLQKLIENLEVVRKDKNISCKFGSLLVCIFFHVQNYFPTVGRVTWDRNKTIVDQLNELI